MDYKEQLQDQRWLGKREQILERDRGRCVFCQSFQFLNVHHWTYDSGKLAWEYPDNRLVTFCMDCHSSFHKQGGFKVTEDYGILSVYDFIYEYPYTIWLVSEMNNHKGIWEVVFKSDVSITLGIFTLCNLKSFIGNTDHHIYISGSHSHDPNDTFNMIEYVTNKIWK